MHQSAKGDDISYFLHHLYCGSQGDHIPPPGNHVLILGEGGPSTQEVIQ